MEHSDKATVVVSFGMIFDSIKLEFTLKKVTNPVIFVFPTATPVVPNPTILNLSLETPIVYEPSILDDVVEIPLMLTISNACSPWGDSDCTIYVPFLFDGISSAFDI